MVTPIVSPNRIVYENKEVFARIDAVIQAHLTELNKPGVLTVRPGYEISAGRLTRTPAIVVTVRNKLEAVPYGQALPSRLEGYPVDVRQANKLELMRRDDPQRYLAFLGSARGEYKPPTFPYERDIQTGMPITAAFGPDAVAAAAPRKEQIPYMPPEGASLKVDPAPMALTCHVSPDAGWMTLKEFIGDIRQTLTVGMYDFTASHILNELQTRLAQAGADLTLTLDHPPKNPTADQTDEETQADLADALRSKLKFAWALERQDPKVSSYIYPSAYHIKVAVSDGTKTWLSSGNWNRSNQPEIDTSDPRTGSVDEIAKKSDRDWHVIIDHAGLSDTFAKYLQNDFEVATQIESDTGVAAASADFFAQGSLTDQEIESIVASVSVRPKVPERYFKPQRIPATGTRNISVQPLLTPDPNVYSGEVLKLIRGATKTFYMQTQYIHPSDKPEDKGLSDLIDAVVELQQRGSVDVRIILSQWQIQNDKTGNPVWWERLQQTGLDLSSVKIQSGVHNKGIVVDSKAVMVSSQNWSGDGVLRNRDAGIIIFDEDAAKYYQEVFLHDWVHMAQPGPSDASVDSVPLTFSGGLRQSPVAMLSASTAHRRRRAIREGETPLEATELSPGQRVALRRLGLVSVERFLSVAKEKESLLSNYLGAPVSPLAMRLSEKVPARASLGPRPQVALGLLLPETVSAVLPHLDLPAAAFNPGAAITAMSESAYLAAVSAAAPLVDVNLIPDMQPIRDQGRRGTCVAHACVAAMEHFYKTQRGQELKFSEQFLFYDAKLNDGLPNADGTFVRVAMPLLFTDGCCLAATWPYNPQPINGNLGQGPAPQQATQEAQQYLIPGANAIQPPTSVAAIKAELARGRCVAIAVPFYESVWLADEIRRTGDIGLPIPGDFTNEGHAVCLVGYEDLLDEAEIGGGRFLVRNSWDSQWGIECPFGAGYGTIPYAYITTYCREAYSIV